MAFEREKFSGNIGAGSKSISLYVYKTDDTKAATIADDYFDPLVDTLEVGDVILATTDMTTTAGGLILFVDSNDGTNVTTGFVANA